MSTARDLLREAASALAPLGEGAGRTARWLLKEATGWDEGELLRRLDEPLAGEPLCRFLAFRERCLAGEPVQYVLGEWDFAGLTLRVDRRALIPRPETELLYEAALARLSPGDRVADVGCGTGCIGLALAKGCPGAGVTLMDISGDALALAAENAALLGLPVTLFQADMARPLPGGPYDMLVSNPPYVADHDMAGLGPAVLDYEPQLALRGGRDGLDCYRALARRAQDSLVPGGWLLLEIGAGQQAAVEALLGAVCEEISCTPDLHGIPRVVSARRKRI